MMIFAIVYIIYFDRLTCLVIDNIWVNQLQDLTVINLKKKRENHHVLR